MKSFNRAFGGNEDNKVGSVAYFSKARLAIVLVSAIDLWISNGSVVLVKAFEAIQEVP